MGVQSGSAYVGPATAQWSAAEWWAAWQGWLAPAAAKRRLDAVVRDAFGAAEIHPVNAGRTALALILRALQQRWPGRSAVVIPAYICPSVTATIRRLGLRPIAADIGPDLNLTPDAVRPALEADPLAVLAVHMHGAPAAIHSLAALCRAAGVPLIDDAAQVVGTAADGTPFGCFGVAGLISFAPSKAVVAGFSGAGGLLIVSDPELRAPIRAMLAELPCACAGFGAFWGFWLRHAAAPVLGARSYLIERLLPAVPTAITEARISGVHAAIAARQFARLAELQAARLAELDILAQSLRRYGTFGFPQFAPGRWLSRAMLSLPAGVDPVVFRHALRRQGILARGPYPLPDLEPPSLLPAVRAIVPRLVEFPLRLSRGVQAIPAAVGVFAAALDARV